MEIERQHRERKQQREREQVSKNIYEKRPIRFNIVHIPFMLIERMRETTSYI